MSCKYDTSIDIRAEILPPRQGAQLVQPDLVQTEENIVHNLRGMVNDDGNRWYIAHTRKYQGA